MDAMKRHSFKGGDHCTDAEIYASNRITPAALAKLLERQRVAEAERRADFARCMRAEEMAREWEGSRG